MKAVVTAGGRIGGAFAELAGTSVKALVEIRGTTMLQRTIEALRAVGATRIAVVGGEEVRNACAAFVERFINESHSGSENMLRALRAWPDDGEPLVYATSDLPYVRADAVGDFLSRMATGTLAVALAQYARYNATFSRGAAGGHHARRRTYCQRRPLFDSERKLREAGRNRDAVFSMRANSPGGWPALLGRSRSGGFFSVA